MGMLYKITSQQFGFLSYPFPSYLWIPERWSTVKHQLSSLCWSWHGPTCYILPLSFQLLLPMLRKKSLGAERKIYKETKWFSEIICTLSQAESENVLFPPQQGWQLQQMIFLCVPVTRNQSNRKWHKWVLVRAGSAQNWAQIPAWNSVVLSSYASLSTPGNYYSSRGLVGKLGTNYANKMSTFSFSKSLALQNIRNCGCSGA